MSANPYLDEVTPLARPFDGYGEVPLLTDWQMAFVPAEGRQTEWESLSFRPAAVPGTVASNLRSQGVFRAGEPLSGEEGPWCFRCHFETGPCDSSETVSLRLDGIATLSEIWFNGQLLLVSESMFARHEVDISALLREQNELLIVCRPLSRALRERRGRKPAARWRTQVVAEQQLRWFRTTLLGRAPGFAPGPEPIGPWRPVTLVRRRGLDVKRKSRRVTIDDGAGVVACEWQLRPFSPADAPIAGQLMSDGRTAPLTIERVDEEYVARATLRIPDAALWMPHTHGEPVLYPVHIEIQLANGCTFTAEEPRVGFRTIDGGADPQGETGLQLSVNGTAIFCRGVVWTPIDGVSLDQHSAATRERLQRLRDAGLNLIRLAGTTAYEGDTFHGACDELGLLVWQDMMFANMDYPFGDPAFHGVVSDEAETELKRLGCHASTAVICGNSEIEQQAAMLGMDPTLGRGEFFGEELPWLANEYCPGVPYISSAPCGGTLPFRTDRGVANYFGVGAYLRPLEDARRANVRFASECLAFANVPEPEVIDGLALSAGEVLTPVSTAWKRAIPRDLGAGWDFEDVRDHYLEVLFRVEPVKLRWADVQRYWELSRLVSGEVMAEVFGEWRRPASACGGGIVLWSADLQPGAGWGILDANGKPKAAYWFLKRALSARAVWMTDEGLNGVDVHVANDWDTALQGTLRVGLYRNGEHKVEECSVAVAIPPHASQTFGLESILGRFVDASYAYRFGPPGHDLAVASLHRDPTGALLAQSFFQPGGRRASRAPIAELGLSGQAICLPNGSVEVAISGRRFAYGVRLSAPGCLPDDAYFGMEPGIERRVIIAATASAKTPERVTVAAANAEGTFSIRTERSPC